MAPYAKEEMSKANVKMIQNMGGRRHRLHRSFQWRTIGCCDRGPPQKYREREPTLAAANKGQDR